MVYARKTFDKKKGCENSKKRKEISQTNAVLIYQIFYPDLTGSKLW